MLTDLKQTETMENCSPDKRSTSESYSFFSESFFSLLYLEKQL